MKLTRTGFDTKNPMELVTPTTLGHNTKWIASALFSPFIVLAFIGHLSEVNLLFGILVPFGYLFLAFFVNPRQLFFKVDREEDKPQ